MVFLNVQEKVQEKLRIPHIQQWYILGIKKRNDSNKKILKGTVTQNYLNKFFHVKNNSESSS